MQLHVLVILLVACLAVSPAFGQAGLVAGSTVLLDPATMNNGHLGVVELNGKIYVTARGIVGAVVGPPHHVYEFDCTGTLLATYEQSASANTSAWGWRDGATDGTNLYFGFDGGIEEIAPTQLVPLGSGPTPVLSTTIGTDAAGVSIGVHRGLAMDATGFWTGSFGSTLWHVPFGGGPFDASWPLPAAPGDWSIYGLAYDATSGNLWVNSAPNAGPIAEIDLTTGTLTGASMARAAPTSAQGGLSLLTGCPVPGTGGGLILVGVDQATPDTYSFYDTSPGGKLLTGVSGGPQNQGMTPILLSGGAPSSMDWSLISSPLGTPLAGSLALTLANVGLTGTPPAFTTPGLPCFTLGHNLSVPTGFAVCVADGIGGGVLCPLLSGMSLHGFFPQDNSLDDPTLAALPGFVLPAGTSIYMQSVYLTPAGGLACTNVSGWDFLPCANLQNFDALATGVGNAPPGWTNPSGGLAWTVHTGGTVSTATGPTSANSLPNYMYCETSGAGAGGALFQMDTCYHDVTSLQAFTLDFQLSRIGATIGTLRVLQDDGAGTFTTVLATYTGADLTQVQGGVEWSAESLPFIPLGPGVAFRFEYTSGTSFSGDLAIDDYNVL